MSNDDNGPFTPAQVEALADSFCASADNLRTRLQAEAIAIGALQEGPERTSRKAATALLQDAEQELRQRANGLLADTAAAIVTGLGRPQQHVMDLTHAAAEQIRKITRINDATGLVAGLLVLAGGIASGNPAPVLAGMETIGTQLKAIKASQSTKTT